MDVTTIAALASLNGLFQAGKQAEQAAQTIAAAGAPASNVTSDAAPSTNPPRLVPTLTPDNDGLLQAAVGLQEASLAYKANAAALKVENDLSRQLISDIRL